MTKNINGIDVSECVFFKERYTRIGDDVDNDVSFENHCMLSEYTFSIGNCEKINCYFKQLQRLKEENEELKAKLQTLDDEVLTVEITLDEFERYKKYKQALEEIRELMQKCEIEDISCVQCKERKRCHCDLTRLLIDKINEVLNDRD